MQYAPFYVAMEKGFFTEVGIELEFDYSFETDGVALVGANEIQFSVVSGEQVPIARAEGLPIVYIMAWYEKYPVAVISKTEQNVQKPQDLAGKRIALPGLFGANYVGLRALMGVVNLSESDLTLESVGFNQVEVLAADTSEVIVGYIANEPVQLAALGYDLNVILVADYLDLVSNGIITNEITIRENPDLVERMVSATLKSIQYAVEHPEEAFKACFKYVEGTGRCRSGGSIRCAQSFPGTLSDRSLRIQRSGSLGKYAGCFVEYGSYERSHSAGSGIYQ